MDMPVPATVQMLPAVAQSSGAVVALGLGVGMVVAVSVGAAVAVAVGAVVAVPVGAGGAVAVALGGAVGLADGGGSGGDAVGEAVAVAVGSGVGPSSSSLQATAQHSSIAVRRARTRWRAADLARSGGVFIAGVVGWRGEDGSDSKDKSGLGGGDWRLPRLLYGCAACQAATISAWRGVRPRRRRVLKPEAMARRPL
jgi:hypothetical protein